MSGLFQFGCGKLWVQGSGNLIRLRPAIVGGAMCTACSSTFLFPCWIYLFAQLGVMLFSSTVIIVIYTFFLQTPLLMLAGPTGDCCGAVSLLLCRRPRRLVAWMFRVHSKAKREQKQTLESRRQRLTWVHGTARRLRAWQLWVLATSHLCCPLGAPGTGRYDHGGPRDASGTGGIATCFVLFLS